MKKIIIILLLTAIATTAFGYDFIYVPNRLTRSGDPFAVKERVMRYNDRVVELDAVKNLYYREYEGEKYYCVDGTVTETSDEVKAREAREREAYLSAVVAIGPTAAMFRWTLEQHFGAGAVTNRLVTEDTVTLYFINRRRTGTNEDTDGTDTMILTRGFEAILKITKTGNIWTFPWDLIPEL